jgi:hypothetical protein
MWAHDMIETARLVVRHTRQRLPVRVIRNVPPVFTPAAVAVACTSPWMFGYDHTSPPARLFTSTPPTRLTVRSNTAPDVSITAPKLYTSTTNVGNVFGPQRQRHMRPQTSRLHRRRSRARRTRNRPQLIIDEAPAPAAVMSARSVTPAGDANDPAARTPHTRTPVLQSREQRHVLMLTTRTTNRRVMASGSRHRASSPSVDASADTVRSRNRCMRPDEHLNDS